jgi:hypothetical protein
MKNHFLTSRSSRLRGFMFLLTLGLASIAWGDTPTTQEDADDPPVAAALVPTYIAIGRDLSLRLVLMRKTLNDLTLDASTRLQAADLLQGCQKEVDGLVTELMNGELPSSRNVLRVPGDLRTKRGQLYQIIGTDQSQLLDEMLSSLRGEARSTLGHVLLMVESLNPPAAQIEKCKSILSSADAKAEALPHLDLSPQDYDAQRQKMDAMLNSVRDDLTKTLTPEEMDRLGPKFLGLFPTQQENH